MSINDNFYLDKKEPNKSCLLAMRDILLSCDKNITETICLPDGQANGANGGAGTYGTHAPGRPRLVVRPDQGHWVQEIVLRGVVRLPVLLELGKCRVGDHERAGAPRGAAGPGDPVRRRRVPEESRSTCETTRVACLYRVRTETKHKPRKKER